jgi:nucleoside-diphosphate-sugar epimerase
MRIWILGCGAVGTALGLHLAAQGHEVWGVRRDAARIPAPLHGLSADLVTGAGLERLPDAVEAVFFTASAGGGSEAEYRDVYVRGLGRLIARLRASGEQPRRVLFTSSTAVYGEEGGAWVDEDSECAPGSFNGRLLLEAEHRLLGSGYPATVLRFGGIYGREGAGRLVEAVRRGAPCREDQYTNRIHRDDCAAALAHVLGLEAPAAIYNAVDDAPDAQCEVMRWLAARLGVPPPVPGSAGPMPARGNKRCSNARIKASGFAFQYPSYREGYAAVLAAEIPQAAAHG